MDLRSLFQSSPEQQIQKARKKVKEPHGDPATRMNAAHRLLEMGTTESLRALLDRFTISVSPSSQDEEEREEVLSWIVGCGERAVPALVSFLREERQLYWPLMALKRILSLKRFSEEITRILKYHWENPPASSDPTAQMIRLLEGIKDPELVATIVPFLEHESDDVRLAAVDYLFGQDESDAREPILECLLASEDRPRVRGHILEGISHRRWNVKGFRPRLEASLPEGYTVTREGLVKSAGRAR